MNTPRRRTGLGMAIGKKLLDSMEGTIAVESEKGAGIAFTVTIPHRIAEKSDLSEHRNVEIDPDAFRGKRILLAEDNELNAEIATIQLEELGIQVTRAADGNEAVKIFSENPPDTFDVILMDIMMPGMNGYEATAVIRSMPGRPDARRIPIIAMTAHAFAEDVQASLDAGMNGHLSKPIVMEEVVNAIVRNLNS